MSTNHTPHQAIAWIDAHGGCTADWQCSAAYARATGNMDGWRACFILLNDRPAELSRHIDQGNGHTLMLNIALAGEHPKTKGTPIRWDATLKVGKGRYVRAYGYSPDFPTALAAAISYRHESQQIGSLTWWRESDANWVSWLGEMSLRAHQVTAPTDEAPYWHFEASGNAPTLDEAALLASMRHA